MRPSICGSSLSLIPSGWEYWVCRRAEWQSWQPPRPVMMRRRIAGLFARSCRSTRCVSSPTYRYRAEAPPPTSTTLPTPGSSCRCWFNGRTRYRRTAAGLHLATAGLEGARSAGAACPSQDRNARLGHRKQFYQDSRQRHSRRIPVQSQGNRRVSQDCPGFFGPLRSRNGAKEIEAGKTAALNSTARPDSENRCYGTV